MLVVFRSYGIPRTIDRRGPQFVQFVNGYLNLLLSGALTSSRHALQVAASAEILVATSVATLVRITNACGASPSRSSMTFCSMLMTFERGGFCVSMARTKDWSFFSSPHASIKTPSPSLRTYPLIPNSWASLNTCGLKPTPWTVPLTLTRSPLWLCFLS